MLTTTGVARLTRLADLLDTVKPEEFWLQAWFASRKLTEKELAGLFAWDDQGPPDYTETECGAVACAIGHALRLPEFNAAGFLPRQTPINYGQGMTTVPSYDPGDGEEPVTHWTAVAAFFHLPCPPGSNPTREAIYLFTHGAYPNGNDTGPAEVAARVRDYVARHRPTEEFK